MGVVQPPRLLLGQTLLRVRVDGMDQVTGGIDLFGRQQQARLPTSGGTRRKESESVFSDPRRDHEGFRTN